MYHCAYKNAKTFHCFQDFSETVSYDLLQKVARSSCINKGSYLLDKMMKVRNKATANTCKPVFGNKVRAEEFFHQELNQQETEFLMLSKVSILFSYLPCTRDSKHVLTIFLRTFSGAYNRAVLTFELNL